LYEEETANWRVRQSSVADDRARRVSDWLADRQANAQLLATRPSVRAALRAYYDAGQLPGRPAATLRELTASLDEIEGVYSHTRVYVLDRDAHVMARSSRSLPLSPVLTEICREVAATGLSRIDLVGKTPDDTLVSFGVAVVPEPGAPGANRTPGQPLGVALVVLDAVHTLFPLVTREVVPTRTGETLLVRREGNDVVFFSPLQNVAASSQYLRFPLSTAPAPARLALEGRQTFGEYRDYRSVPVLAAMQRIPLTGWGLVRKIDRAEALEGFRRMAIIESLAGGFLCVLPGGLLMFHRRDVLARARKQDEEKFRELLDAAPDAMVITDRGGRLELVNAQAEKMFGIERGQLVGEPMGMLVAEFALGKAVEAAPRHFSDLVAQHLDATVEMHGLHKDGTQFPAEVRLNRVETVKGVLISCGIRDITERKRAEEDLRKLNEELDEHVRQRTTELEAVNQELEAFTYSVSHDLRAPLRHIDGFSKLLVEGHQAELSPDAQEYVATIRDSVLQMGRLIDDLLNLARVGRKQMAVQVTGPNSLVEEVRADLNRANPDRLIEWKVGTLPYIECDPALMKQVFANLLSNAVKFTRPRKPAVIEVGATSQDGRPVFFVRDNGVGFSMKYASKLFGVFQRLHRSEDFEGTGVGLATVQRIIHKHRGRVWGEAELNNGATFYFTLGSLDDCPTEKRG
jgi:PAS domain S-box-containing protein